MLLGPSWATYAWAEAIRRKSQHEAFVLLSGALDIAREVHAEFIVGFSLGTKASMRLTQPKSYS